MREIKLAKLLSRTRNGRNNRINELTAGAARAAIVALFGNAIDFGMTSPKTRTRTSGRPTLSVQ